MGEVIRIEGTVENVVFFNENNGYIVFYLNSNEKLISVVGEIGEVDEGESLILEGNYVENQRFGHQFKAEYCERKLPDTVVNIEKYLASGAIKGIGASLAKKIVNVFGKDTLEIIEKTPERLVEVKGISPKKCKEIASESKKLFSLRIITSYLAKYDIKSRYAMKAYQKYGSDTLDLIKLNPYIMCDDIIELEFKKADIMASDLNIEYNSNKRVIAGIKYLLKENAELVGHSCLPFDVLMNMTVDNLKIVEDDFYFSYNTAIENRDIFKYTKNNREYAYLPEYYYAETFIADRIKVLNNFPSSENYDFDSAIEKEEKANNIKYETLQKSAIALALSHNIMILTGGPGTGKTTTLNAIISIFDKKGKNVLLAAPTGRAAKRMSELTGYEAKTIHRLLEVVYDSMGRQTFYHNETNPLDCEVLIIDEMSMVDVLLFESLLRALRVGTRLIMVGDSDQLPSVGAGNLLKDLIESNAINVIQLKEVFRQSSQSCIITNAHKIVSGEYPDLTRTDNDFFFMKRTDYDEAVQLIVSLVKTRLPNAYGYSPLDDIQVLSPTKKTNVGTVELNKMLQGELNPPSKSKAECKGLIYTFRVGDKVMQNKNNYSITWTKNDETGEGIFNGDIGIIKNINNNTKTAVIEFDGRKTTYSFETLSQIELAYAITVHKSQGCEFEAVIMPVMGGFEKLYFRNLLYTAVTRAKKLLILIGTPDKVYSMVDNNRRTNRYTCLQDMLIDNDKFPKEAEPVERPSILETLANIENEKGEDDNV